MPYKNPAKFLSQKTTPKTAVSRGNPIQAPQPQHFPPNQFSDSPRVHTEGSDASWIGSAAANKMREDAGPSAIATFVAFCKRFAAVRSRAQSHPSAIPAQASTINNQLSTINYTAPPCAPQLLSLSQTMYGPLALISTH